MANAIMDFLKRTFLSKGSIDKVNKISKGYEEEMYSPMNNYEWIENVKKRQKGIYEDDDY